MEVRRFCVLHHLGFGFLSLSFLILDLISDLELGGEGMDIWAKEGIYEREREKEIINVCWSMTRSISVGLI